jgi:hypothetical protein
MQNTSSDCVLLIVSQISTFLGLNMTNYYHIGDLSENLLFFQRKQCQIGIAGLFDNAVC